MHSAAQPRTFAVRASKDGQLARPRATGEEALIRAAARVFRSKGYRNATIDDIAEAAGISRPTVYQYAKSKRWLLDRIVGDVIDDLGYRMLANIRVGADPRERLRDVIHAYVVASVKNRAFYPIVTSEVTELSPAVRKHLHEWEHRMQREFRTLIAECIDVERLGSGANVAVTANLILTMLTSLSQWYDPDGPVSPEHLTDHILTVISGILPEPQSAIA